MTLDERLDLLVSVKTAEFDEGAVMPAIDVPDEMRLPAGSRVAFLWAQTGALPWWYSQQGRIHDASMLAVEQWPARVAIGQQVVPEAEWVYANPFYASTWRTASPYDLVVGMPPEGVRVARRLAVDFNAVPLMALDLAVNIGRKAALWLPPLFSPTASGDAFRERFDFTHEQALVDAFRREHPALRSRVLARPVAPDWDRRDPWGSKELVLAWTDPEAADVVVTALAGPSGVHIAHLQPAQ